MKHGSLLARTKFVLWKYAPPLFYLARWARKALNDSRERAIARQLPPLIDAFRSRHGDTIQAGPFRGMKYASEGYGSTVLPRLCGSFEAEIQTALQSAVDEGPRVVVNIGCEKGYYAVGLALRLPTTRVHAFDINAKARQATEDLARLNGVEDQVVVDGECTHQRLRGLIEPGTLVLCDIEGCELELLDPERVPELRSTPIIVELHDHERLDVALTPKLLGRFRDSHAIQVFSKAARNPGQYTSLDFLPADKAWLSVHEERMPKQQWAYLRPVRKESPAMASPTRDEVASSPASR